MRPKWTARALATGRLPGSPRQTAQVCTLGGSPKDSGQPQNIFVAVASWTWISRPMTASSCPPAPPRWTLRGLLRHGRGSVEGERLLERVGGVQQPVLAEGGAGELQPDGQPVAERRRGSRSRGCPPSDIGTVQ